MITRRVASTLALVVVACLLVGACSDDKDTSSNGSNSSNAASTTLPAASNPGADCPFSGTTTPTQGDGAASGTVIDKMTPSVAGCIDNVTIDFKTPPPAWGVAYSNGPFVDSTTGKTITVPGPANLVVSFTSTTYPGLPGGATPATIPAPSNNYVKGINVITGADGSLQFIISLPSQLQYMTSQSKTPSNFVLSIG